MKIQFACRSIIAASLVASSGIALAEQIDEHGTTTPTVALTLRGEQARKQGEVIAESLRKEVAGASASYDPQMISLIEAAAAQFDKPHDTYLFTQTSSSRRAITGGGISSPLSVDNPVEGDTRSFSTCSMGALYATNTSTTQRFEGGQWVTTDTHIWRTSTCSSAV